MISYPSDPAGFASDSDYAKLQEQIDNAYLSSRGDVLEHYRDEYGTDWKSHAAADLAGTSDKSSRAYKSAMRQFQMDKRTGQERYKGERVSAATKEKYKALGKTLPPKGKTATVTFSGYVYYSRKAYPKNFTRDLDEEQTQQLLEGNFWPVFEAYEINMGDIEGIEVDSIDVQF